MKHTSAIDPALAAVLQANGYKFAHRLPTGEIAGIMPMIYTVGLFVGLDETGYRTRFCYPTFADAALALLEWNGSGDPPGPWIKEKGAPGGDRANPNIGGVPVVVEDIEETE